jgi:hypothetical protein
MYSGKFCERAQILRAGHAMRRDLRLAMSAYSSEMPIRHILKAGLQSNVERHDGLSHAGFRPSRRACREGRK